MPLHGTWSRRSIISAFSSLGAGGLGHLIFSKKVHASSRKAQAFALVGDRWHNFHYIRTSLMKTLVEGLGLSIDFRCEPTLLSQETLEGYRLLIILCDGMYFPGGYTTPFVMYEPGKNEIISDPPYPKIDETNEMWITPEQGKAVKAFVENGGSALFFHNSHYMSIANKDYRDVIGALFTGHTPFIPHKIKIVNDSHPITKGVRDFIITEEQHFLIYDKDQQYVLARSENLAGQEFTGSQGNQGTSCEACWAYDYAKGRVCFMTPGHMITTFWNPEYVKLQQNAVKWLLRM